ncbi:hypothetical protein FHW69_000303 [Luteibacter sp. Sphag1AF]|uniref:hypothetical protein n=1 Tax=Luteibacter sp. Sphag1AF TaxID=2587031 RepID=UPI00161CD1DE|nr:hypothetical protein [Luteibacter sp. Sphag1AF]MBB3225713.1 hypothetical protein [Luteibacter sp. Sphag1AF]
MAERAFPNYVMTSGAGKDGARYSAYLVVRPEGGSRRPDGTTRPEYFTVYDNRSFRELATAEEAAEKALALVQGVDDDGTPVFAEGETGFDDDRPGESDAEPLAE